MLLCPAANINIVQSKYKSSIVSLILGNIICFYDHIIVNKHGGHFLLQFSSNLKADGRLAIEPGGAG